MQNTPLNCIKTFNTETIPKLTASKVQQLVKILNEPIVNIQQLKIYLMKGIPDEAKILREYSWKIILGYLSNNKDEWQESIKKNEKTYEQFIKMFLPPERYPEYPYIMNKKQQRWTELKPDFELWQQIQKDTSRTHAQLSFFSTPAQPIMIPFLTSPRKQKFKVIYGQSPQLYKQFLVDKQMQRKTYRYDYMSRILYIYAKLNPRIRYVQGMNQVLAPIFYIVNIGKSSSIDEVSSFFMFNNVITNIIQLHIKDLDKSQSGIYGKMNQINQMLIVLSQKIWVRFQKLKIDPFYYCFRWITLLFAQEFPLFDTLRIWESIFSFENRMLFMCFFAISIIISFQNTILNNDFVYVLQYLQKINDNVDLNTVLLNAQKLYTQYDGYDFKQNAKVRKEELTKRLEKEAKKDQSKKKMSKIKNFISTILE